MTISQTQLAQALSEPEIKRFWLGYFQEGFREEVQQLLLEHFEALKANTGFTRSELAKKIGRRPEQVTRWLSSSTNLEMDTISDMALGMGLVPRLRFEEVGTLFAAERPNRSNDVSDYVTQAQTVIDNSPANNNYSYVYHPNAAASS